MLVEPKYLIMIEAGGVGNNHNKFYKMLPNSTGTFEAEWGAVGVAGRKMTYNLSSFETKYDEKIRKGYVDRSAEHFAVLSATPTITTPASAAKQPLIQAVVKKMLDWANQTIKRNYTMATDAITQLAVDEAQTAIDKLSVTSSVTDFNRGLIKLFTIIPRRMVKVADYLADTPNDIGKIIDREQSLLDTVSGQVRKPTVLKDNGENKDILEQYGLEIKECGIKETEKVKSCLDDYTQKKFVRCFHVINKETRDKFEKYCEKENVKKSEIKYFYHGSRNENYWNILTQGLKLHPNQRVQRAGTMFGYGLYFAPKARKSMGYTSLRGTFWAHGNQNTAMLMVFKVAMKKPKEMTQYSPSVASWTEKDCKRAGYGSVFAHAGVSLMNDEAIVYNEDACTISYIIEIKD